jgi:hypothetical protein
VQTIPSFTGTGFEAVRSGPGGNKPDRPDANSQNELMKLGSDSEFPNFPFQSYAFLSRAALQRCHQGYCKTRGGDFTRKRARRRDYLKKSAKMTWHFRPFFGSNLTAPRRPPGVGYIFC